MNSESLILLKVSCLMIEYRSHLKKNICVPRYVASIFFFFFETLLLIVVCLREHDDDDENLKNKIILVCSSLKWKWLMKRKQTIRKFYTQQIFFYKYIFFFYFADTKNSAGLVGCIEEVSHNAIAVYWNPLESSAKVRISPCFTMCVCLYPCKYEFFVIKIQICFNQCDKCL
jgi:hypothetical protein